MAHSTGGMGRPPRRINSFEVSLIETVVISASCRFENTVTYCSGAGVYGGLGILIGRLLEYRYPRALCFLEARCTWHTYTRCFMMVHASRLVILCPAFVFARCHEESTESLMLCHFP